MTLAVYTIKSPAIQVQLEAPRKGNSYLYICPICGDQWASVVCTNSEYFPARRPCLRHRWAGMIPGSILDHMTDPMFMGVGDYFISLPAVPREILEYELEVHAQFFEKGVLE